MSDLRTHSFLITVEASADVDPSVVKGNIESALTLYTTTRTLNELERADGFVFSAHVDLQPSNADGPFQIFQYEQDDANNTTFVAERATWVRALAEAQDLENRGVFAKVYDAAGQSVYTSEG